MEWYFDHVGAGEERVFLRWTSIQSQDGMGWGRGGGGMVKLLAVSCYRSEFADFSVAMWFSLIHQTGMNGRCPQAESKPSNVTCNGGSNTCLHGSCTGSICALYETTECECHQNTDQTCHVCCNNTQVSNKDCTISNWSYRLRRYFHEIRSQWTPDERFYTLSHQLMNFKLI